MRSNRRKNWFIKRIALGFAIAAIAAPVAQAKVDEGSSVQANGYQSFVTDFPSSSAVSTSSNQIELVRVEQPRSTPSKVALAAGNQIELVRAQTRVTGSDVAAADYGMPRAMPHDYALSSGDQIEVVRSTPNGTTSDKIEFVRSQPRSIGEPQLASRFGQPNATTGDQLASWNVNWTDAGIGAGLALALVLLGVGAALASRHVGRAQTA
jgi:hypothetical protein